MLNEKEYELWCRFLDKCAEEKGKMILEVYRLYEECSVSDRALMLKKAAEIGKEIYTLLEAVPV